MKAVLVFLSLSASAAVSQEVSLKASRGLARAYEYKFGERKWLGGAPQPVRQPALPAAGPAAGPSALPAAGPSALPAAGPSALPAAGPSALPAAGPSALPAAGPSALPAAAGAAQPGPAPSFWRKCLRVFRREKGPGPLPLSEFQTPLARAVYQNLYIAEPALKKLWPNKKSRRELAPLLEGLMRLLDSSGANPKIKKHISYLPHLESALQKAPDMIQFLESHQGKLEDSINREVFQAVLASFAKHVPAYLADNQPALLDWPRINRILKVISGFDKTNGYVSFFQIREAIEEAYSLKEYICCKTD